MTGRRPGTAPRPRMGDAQHAAVTCELSRLTLGGRPDRPELELDPIDVERLAQDLTAAAEDARLRDLLARPTDRLRSSKRGRR